MTNIKMKKKVQNIVLCTCNVHTVPARYSISILQINQVDSKQMQYVLCYIAQIHSI